MRNRADVFCDFCEETTAHAFLQIGDRERKWWARLLWVIVLLCFTAVFIWQAQLLVQKYLQYDTTTTTTVSSVPGLQFPMITICNVNPYQRDRIPTDSDMAKYVRMVDRASNTSTMAELIEMCRDRDDMVSQLFCSVCDFGNETDQKPISSNVSDSDQSTAIPTNTSETDQSTAIPSNTSSTDQSVDSIKQPENATGDDEYRMSIIDIENKAFKITGTLAAAGHMYQDSTQPMDDLIQECQFKAGDCGHTQAVPHPWYGTCFRINRDGHFMSCRPGATYGLVLELHVNSSQYLPSTFGVGVRIGIEQAGRMASFPEIDGVSAPVGMATSIGMTLVETNRLGSPYGNCVDDSTANSTVGAYYYGGNYTLGGCSASCLQKQIVQNCGCWYFPYAPPPESHSQGIPLCANVSALTCASNQETRAYKHDCICYPLCNERKYQLTISHSYWPKFPVARCPPKSMDCVDPEEYAVKNLLKLQIYYDTMNKYTYNETASYTTLSLVSDFGGQLGLWIGASFCTVIEVISFLISMIGTCFGCANHNVEKHPNRRNIRKNRQKVVVPDDLFRMNTNTLTHANLWHVPRPCYYH